MFFENLNIYWGVFFGTGLTFLTTALGAAIVLFFNKISLRFERICLGLASGIMVAASVWSLIIPAIELSKNKTVPEYVPAIVGITVGALFLFMLDKLIPHIHLGNKIPEGTFVSDKILKIKNKKKLKNIDRINVQKQNKTHKTENSYKKTSLLMAAITLHNLPEGMAVGLSFALALQANNSINIGAALSLTTGIAIQNIPEGAAISLPLRQNGFGKWKAFIYGALSGIVEPIGGFITVVLVGAITSILPYFLSFAAGAMLFVVVEELIPEASRGNHSDLAVCFFMIGFVLMMTLDIAFN